jgi:hypothetical protein
MAGLDPAIHLLRKSWIAGSSPAMTVESGDWLKPTNPPKNKLIPACQIALIFLPASLIEGVVDRDV